MLPEGIIFDLDDTILQFDSISKPVWIEVCRKYSANVGIEDSKLFDAIEQTRKWFWSNEERHKKGRLDLSWARRTIVSTALEKIAASNVQQLADAIAEEYSTERERRMSFFPGAEEALYFFFFSQGVKLVLVTNGQADTQRRKINRFRLDRFFQDILIEGEVGYGKPEPQIYTLALEKLGFMADDVWAVGDNLEWDVDGPQKAGIFGIWNDYANKGLPLETKYKPNRIINKIVELVK